MSHHASENMFMPEDFRKSLGLGPTKYFPDGKLNKDDEGEIRIAITAHEDKVIIDFGSKVTWIGFTKEQAIEIGNLLIQKASE